MLDRRAFLLGAAVLALGPGCALFRSPSEIDAAFADLDALLATLDEESRGKAIPVSAEMKRETRALVSTHEAFSARFNEMAADLEVPSETLNTLVTDYVAERTSRRNDLLRLQYELRAAVPADAWPRVLDILNRKGQALSARAT